MNLPEWGDACVLEAFFAASLDNNSRAAEESLVQLKELSASRDTQYFRQLAIAFIVARDDDSTGAALKFKQFRDELKSSADHPNAFWLSQLQRASAIANVV